MLPNYRKCIKIAVYWRFNFKKNCFNLFSYLNKLLFYYIVDIIVWEQLVSKYEYIICNIYTIT